MCSNLSFKFYFNNFRFVNNIDSRGLDKCTTFLSMVDFFSAFENEEDIFVSVIIAQDINWNEEILQDKINDIKRSLTIEIGSPESTKVYIKYPDKEKIIILDLNSCTEKLRKTQLLTKLNTKESFGISLIVEALKQGLVGYFNERPVYIRSLTDVTLVLNGVSSDESSNCISLDYTLFRSDILSFSWLILHIYNIIYDAIRLNKVNFFDELNEKCKDNYVSETFNNILPRVYEEISIKGVPLTKEMNYIIEDKLINFFFFIDKTEENKKQVVVSVDDVRKRIEIISYGIDNLKTNVFMEDKGINEEFIYIAKFIAQNIHILKHQLKITYDRLPWEEIEFCLISFISSYTKHKFFNIICNIILDLKKIINYLEIFKVELNKLKDEIKEKDINKKFPKQINKTHLETVFELHKDYYLIKDIYSLERIDRYVTVALEIDLDKDHELGKLIIERVLQVIGESLKNTIESPNLSDDVIMLLLYLAPKNIKDIVTSLRDSLSHFHTLEKKMEFENIKEIDYFKQIQNDLQKVKNEINDIFYKKKLKIVKIIINKIIDSNELDEVKKLLKVVNKSEFGKIEMSNGVIKDIVEIKELVEKLRIKIKNPTKEEKDLFDKIDCIIISQQNELKNSEVNYLDGLSLLNSIKNSNNLTLIQSSCRFYFKATKLLIPPDKLKDIIGLVADIQDSVKLREESSDEIVKLTYKIFWTIEFNIGRIQGIKKFKEILLKKEEDTDNNVEETVKNVFDEIIKKLRETSIQDSEIFINAYKTKEKSNRDFKVKKEKLLKLKMEIIPLLDKLENKELSKSDNLVQSTFAELDKLLNNKPIQKMFTNGKWMECKKKVETLEIRDNYETLFNSIKNYIKDEKYDMSTCFREFVSSFKDLKVKDALIKSIHIITDSLFKEQIHIFFDKRLEILKKLLFFMNNNKNPLQKYLEDEKIQFAVEMLVLDLTNVLESDGRFGDNLLNMERCSPILIGKILRNYLAHGNALIDILPCDPSAAILSNALRFIKEGSYFFLNEKRLIGQRIIGNLSDLANQYRQGLDFVTTQDDMFTAAKEGNLEKMKDYINKGADIKARDYRGWSGLHFAAQGNNVDVFQFFLDKSISPDIQDINGRTSFHMAATFGSNDIIKILLEKGADVNSVSKNKQSLLHSAAKHGHIEVVKTLLQMKVNVNDKNMENLSALELALLNGHDDVYKYLLENGATSEIGDICNYGFTPLHIAALEGNIIEAENLLISVKGFEKTAILEAKDEGGRTPLYLAVFYGHDDLVNLLLKEGADVNSTSNDSSTSLHVAATHDHANVLETLLKYEAIIDFPHKWFYTALDFAALLGNERAVEILLRNKASVSPQNECGDTPLHFAAKSGNRKVVEILLNEKIDVNITNKIGYTALHVAALHGYTLIIDILLDRNANINALDASGRTPLHFAALGGKKNVVDQLLEKGAMFDITDENELTALEVAKYYGNKDIGRRLLEEKCKVESKQNEGGASLKLSNDMFREQFIFAIEMDDFEDVKSFVERGFKDDILDQKGWRPLHFAVHCGHVDIVKLLLDKKANCNVVDYDETTPLHIATKINVTGNNKIIQMLLDAGANVDPRNRYKMTPLHFAADNCEKHMVELLLERGAYFDARDHNDMTPLHYGATHGNESVVKHLLEKGANVNVKSNCGLTPLHLSASKGHKGMVDILLKKGADFKAQDINGMTPLHFASRYGYTEVVEILLTKGTDIDPRSIHEGTPLHYGALYGHKRVVELLVKEGADVNAKNDNGRTPLHYAADICDKCMIDLLLENGANYEAGDSNGMTPLHYASRKGHVEIVETLLMKVTDIDQRDVFQATPLNYAAFHGHRRVAELLLFEGADINTKNYKGKTSLHHAADKCDQYMVELLLENGANFEVQDDNGRTPLHYGAILSNKGVVERLLKKGAKVSVRDINDKRPVDYGIMKYNISVNEAQINTPDNQALTTLDFETEGSHKNI